MPRLTDLTAATTPLDGTEEVYVVESGNSRKSTTQDIADLVDVPTVPEFATQAEAEAGVLNDVLMTPLRTEQHMLANALGWGQAWQNLTGSRAVATSYQNTTGRPIMVAIEPSSATAGQFEVSTNNATWVRVGTIILSGSDVRQGAWIVPPGHYYRQTTGGFSVWSELR